MVIVYSLRSSSLLSVLIISTDSVCISDSIFALRYSVLFSPYTRLIESSLPICFLFFSISSLYLSISSPVRVSLASVSDIFCLKSAYFSLSFSRRDVRLERFFLRLAISSSTSATRLTAPAAATTPVSAISTSRRSLISFISLASSSLNPCSFLIWPKQLFSSLLACSSVAITSSRTSDAFTALLLNSSSFTATIRSLAAASPASSVRASSFPRSLFLISSLISS